jgi:hypothetical protein
MWFSPSLRNVNIISHGRGSQHEREMAVTAILRNIGRFLVIHDRAVLAVTVRLRQGIR